MENSDLLMLLNDVARLLRVAIDKRARMHDMTRAQWAMLIWLNRHSGLSQKELAEMLEVEPITVARLVDRLEQRGMVERRPDPTDRRVWRLHLRPEARTILDEINEERSDIARITTAGIDPETLATMAAGLARMKATLCGSRRGACADVGATTDTNVA
jgi:MarR family transcriptional regulator for hemolysin